MAVPAPQAVVRVRLPESGAAQLRRATGGSRILSRAGGALAIALLVGHLAFSLWPALATISNDFANYYVPARLVLSGASLDRLYERNWFQNEIRRAGIDRLGYFAPNPPPNALLLLPVAALPPAAAKAVWSAGLALALLGSFLLIRRVQPAASPWLPAMAFLLQSASLANALLYGPPYPLLLLLLCASLWLLVSGRPVLAGALLAPVAALKLYGLPFALAFALTRRWRSLAGFAAGLALIGLASLTLLGPTVHSAYLSESLPATLAGELLDPYATSWQSPASLAHRLFQREPELNPAPLADRPALARALSHAVPATLLMLGVLGCRRGHDPRRLRREWAVLTLASLAASPFTGTYHFVLLSLPIALLLGEAEAEGARGRIALLLLLLAFAASPLPLWFGRWAHGWGNLIAGPRLLVTIVLLGLALAGLLSPLRVVAALAVGGTAGALALHAPHEEAWRRVEVARGYVLSEPVACGDTLAWVTVEGERLVVRDSSGRRFAAEGDAFSPRCDAGRLRYEDSSRSGSSDDPTGEADRDRSLDGRTLVFADRVAGAIVDLTAGGAPRLLARGRLRRPRLSPNGRWVAYQAWQRATRSWDIMAVERASGRVVRVTSDPANELEPAWLPAGDGLLFASDRRRGLGFSALYSVAFEP